MKLGIMQPYLFPYLGYFQLINAVDLFVIYDNVNFIKGGWINRNRILVNNYPSLFSLSLEKKSPFRKINEVTILSDDIQSNKKKILSQVENAYRKAPNFFEIIPLLRSCILNNEANLSKYIFSSIQTLSTLLDIKTNIIFSSAIDKHNSLKGEEKVINICKNLGADIYINMVGGMHLYNKETFKKNGISLQFLQMNNLFYSQLQEPFVPALSIIDVLMFNSKEQVKEMLEQYSLH